MRNSRHKIGCQCPPCLKGKPPVHKNGCKCPACSKLGGSTNKLGGTGVGKSKRGFYSIPPDAYGWISQNGGSRLVRTIIKEAYYSGRTVDNLDAEFLEPVYETGGSEKGFVSLPDRLYKYTHEQDGVPSSMFIRALIMSFLRIRAIV